MYLFLVVPGDGSTGDYLGFEQRNETAGSKRPKMYAKMHISMQKHKVNKIQLTLILILFVFAVVLDQYGNCDTPNSNP